MFRHWRRLLVAGLQICEKCGLAVRHERCVPDRPLRIRSVERVIFPTTTRTTNSYDDELVLDLPNSEGLNRHRRALLLG